MTQKIKNTQENNNKSFLKSFNFKIKDLYNKLLEVLEMKKIEKLVNKTIKDLKNDKDIEKISNKVVKREWYKGQYTYFTEAGYTLIYLLPEKTKIYGATVEDFNKFFECDL